MCCPSAFRLERLCFFAAYQRFVARNSCKKDVRREVRGDTLGFEKSSHKSLPKEVGLFPEFYLWFQADHLGVEFALCAHQNLLQGNGLLVPEQHR